MSSIEAKLEQMKKEIKAFAEEMKKKSKEFFKEASASLFESYPFIKSFSWTQYTPYFNDGDVCEFRVNNDWFTLTTKSGEEIDDPYSAKELADKVKKAPATNAAIEAQIIDLEKKKKAAVAKEEYKEADDFKSQIASLKERLVESSDVEQAVKIGEAYKSVQELLQAFDEDTMKMLFGDHVKVIVTKSKVVVEEYNHD